MAALKKGTLRIGLKRRAYKLRDAMTYILRNEKKVAVHVKFKETVLIVRKKVGRFLNFQAITNKRTLTDLFILQNNLMKTDSPAKMNKTKLFAQGQEMC